MKQGRAGTKKESASGKAGARTGAARGGTGQQALARYWAKRDFAITSEPRGQAVGSDGAPMFVIQKHAASRLHYDLRLEMDGVLVSWAVPKGPSYDPTVKRMAIHVEDHPLDYGSFEGTIPPGQYGAGTVIVWDTGTWQVIGDPRQSMVEGKLVFRLDGHKMSGLWELVRITKPGDKQDAWILFKKKDEFARPQADYDVVRVLPDSVLARTPGPPRQWSAGSASVPAPSAATAAPAPTTKSATAKRAAGGRAARAPDDRIVPGAVPAPLPETLAPQLATFATGVPATGQWIYEIKFDGYRLMTRWKDGKPALITRGGHDWTAKMPRLAAELKDLGIRDGWLDGEIVILDDEGRPSFNALQNAFDHKGGTDAIVYFVFDLPFLEGHDLRRVRLSDRRVLLQSLLEARPSDHIRLSTAFDKDLPSLLASVARMGMEGVVAKRVDSPYQSRRTETWLKLKCRQRQEFVIAGYTTRSDAAAQVASLLLGVHSDDGALVPVGSVGTGWDADEARAVKSKLAAIARADAPFTATGPTSGKAARSGRWTRRKPGSECWVEPRLVAEVEFADWTPDGQIRHASYLGLRDDKPAKAIRREVARPLGPVPAPTANRSSGGVVGGVKVTHGERVIDPQSGLTKLDLVRYYESIADRILPHLKGRPCSLVRGPDGITGQLFFQKHGERIGIPGIRELDASLWPGHGSLLEVASAQALVGCAQMNVIEFHTWNSKVAAIDRPDRMIFDLDPGEGTKWEHVREAAEFVRVLLDELGLRCWLKTSGGKGLHVVVPIAPRLDYATVKAFSGAVVQHLARVLPSRFVARSGAANRVGRIFVDYLRNGHGATTAAAFSARARPGLGVSMPIGWDQLADVRSGAQWTIANARDHLSFQRADPWAGYGRARQGLDAAMRRLGFTPTAGAGD